MTIARKLAEAVRDMGKYDGRPGVDWDLFRHRDAREKAYSLAAEILSRPEVPPSETVQEMTEQLKPAVIDREAWGKTFRETCLNFYSFAVAAVSWAELDEFNQAKWADCGAEVIAAYEAAKGAACGD